MKIIDDLLSTITINSAIKEICQGVFQTAVVTNNCGLASTPQDPGNHHGTTPVADAGNLLKKEVIELARMANSDSIFEAAVGMATLNSLLEVDLNRCIELNAADLLLENGSGKKVAIVGHFPFIERLRHYTQELWVIEQRPQEGDFSENDADQFIPQADVIGITGMTFTNHTIEKMLSLCPQKSYVVVLGGTTPLSPVLFDYGVDAISGTVVIDTSTALRCVSQGATFKQIKGIRLLTMKK